MTAPPLDAGAVNATVADVPLTTDAAPIVGAPGTVTGVTAPDADDDADVPAELVAVTVNVYEVPLARPVTTTGLDTPVPVNPPGLDVTV